MRCGDLFARCRIGGEGVIRAGDGIIGNLGLYLTGDIDITKDTIRGRFHRFGNPVFICHAGGTSRRSSKARIRNFADQLVIQAGQTGLLIFRWQRFSDGKDFVQPDGFTIHRGNRNAILTESGRGKKNEAGGKTCQKLSHGEILSKVDADDASATDADAKTDDASAKSRRQVVSSGTRRRRDSVAEAPTEFKLLLLLLPFMHKPACVAVQVAEKGAARGAARGLLPPGRGHVVFCCEKVMQTPLVTVRPD
jgi:hypothetical protein